MSFRSGRVNYLRPDQNHVNVKQSLAIELLNQLASRQLWNSFKQCLQAHSNKSYIYLSRFLPCDRSTLSYIQMNRYGPSAYGGPSKASATTLCQKCLKRDMSSLLLLAQTQADFSSRHYSYECKAVAQERPYVPRPSRTQQLFNPKLVPKLNSDVPQDLLRR
jgi:hypothetical protein